MYIRRIIVFTIAAVQVFGDQLVTIKNKIISRMFWGRGSLYKVSLHFLIISISSIVLVNGFLFRLQSLFEGNNQALAAASDTIVNSDLLYQGSSLTANLPVVGDALNYQVFSYTVKSGDSLSSIAKAYNISQDTVQWANSKIINPFNPEVKVGMKLRIPEIDGVLYTVKSGDTLDTVVQITKGNRFDIIELNNLVPPKYSLDVGKSLFIPFGELKPPPLPGLYKDYFASPMTHPDCSGYRYIRGFTAYHSGVDWAIGGGCPIRAIAGGEVSFAGWLDNLAGFTVIIDHGGGIKSYYYHGNGVIWVKQGEYVSKGENIMYMGSTGNSTGTHLHLTIRRNGVNVDPSPYVPRYN